MISTRRRAFHIGFRDGYAARKISSDHFIHGGVWAHLEWHRRGYALGKLWRAF